MRVGEGMWCEKRLDGVGKGRGNIFLHLPSFANVSSLRRHAKDTKNSLSISKFTETHNQRLKTKSSRGCIE